MKKVLSIIAVFSVFISLVSCSSRETNEPFPYGSYLYRSYNFVGELVGEGTLYVNESDSGMVAGNWNIREMRDCPNCGAQFGSGFLTGYIENDTMYINLNPDETEIDTKLIGLISGNEFNGDWRWTDRAGFGFSGTFTAVRD